MFSRSPVRLCLLLVGSSCALLTPGVARAATVRVTGDADLAAALALALPGDAIDLAPGGYGPIAITGRGGPGADITLTGEPGATIAGMTITGSTRIVVTGLSVAPAGATAYIDVASSSAVTFSDLHLDGGADGLGVGIWAEADAAGVTIRDSTFLHCSSPMCIRASGPGVLVDHNTFDDLDDSDAIHGFGSGVIRRNHMDHALPHGNGNHNDFVQIGEGGPWTVEDNWFGERTSGAASIWVDSIDKGVIHDVLIQDNVFTGHIEGQDAGIFVAGDGRAVALLPANVRIVNNTVATGLINSLRFGAPYANVPPEQRPFVANNVGDRLVGMCDRIRSEDNVFAAGDACTASDAIGDAHLDATGAPTADSALLLGRADPSVAPPADFFGCARSTTPDIGAIELGACPPGEVAAPAGPPAAVASATPIARVRAVAARVRAVAARILRLRARRLARKVVVVVRCANAGRIRVSVVARRRVLARATHSAGKGQRARFVLRAPRAGLVTVRVHVSGAAGGATRSVRLRAKA